MSNEYKDWIEDVNWFKKKILEDFQKKYPLLEHPEQKDSFINYLLMRMYYVDFPIDWEKDSEWIKNLKMR